MQDGQGLELLCYLVVLASPWLVYLQPAVLRRAVYVWPQMLSVDQWAFQFKLWSTIKDENISRFTSDNKEKFTGMAGVVVTTYNMVAFGGKRSEDSEKIIEEIRNRE